MQLLDTAEQVDGRVLVAAGTGGTVRRLRDPDVAHAVEDALEADAGLGPRERRARAGVDAEPEPEVLAAVHPVEAELVRIVELPRVVVRGAVEHHHGGAGREVDAADRRGDARQPELRVERGLEPQRLLDEGRDAVALVAQLLLELGAFTQIPEHGGEQAGRRLAAGREQVGGDQHDVVDLGQRPVGEGRGGQLRHDVVARFAATVLDVAP